MRNLLGRHRLLGRGIHFHAIAGGEEERFGAADLFAQPPVNRGVAGETLARLNVGRVMADPDAEEIHYAV